VFSAIPAQVSGPVFSVGKLVQLSGPVISADQLSSAVFSRAAGIGYTELFYLLNSLMKPSKAYRLLLANSQHATQRPLAAAVAYMVTDAKPISSA